MRRSAAVVVLVGATLVPAFAAGQELAPGLDGAWEIVSMATAAGQTVTSPQPGLLLFTGSHYSYTLVTGDRPRPPLPPGVVSTTDLLRAWNPFSANAGTFEVSGDSMIRRPVVAKSPATMAPGAFNRYTFQLVADTLWVTTVGTESGPARNPTTVRYERVR